MKPKSLKEFQDEVATKHHWGSWSEIMDTGMDEGMLKMLLDEAAELYARSVWDAACEADRENMIASMPVGKDLKAWDFVIWSKNHFESPKPEYNPL